MAPPETVIITEDTAPLPPPPPPPPPPAPYVSPHLGTIEESDEWTSENGLDSHDSEYIDTAEYEAGGDLYDPSEVPTVDSMSLDSNPTDEPNIFSASPLPITLVKPKAKKARKGKGVANKVMLPLSEIFIFIFSFFSLIFFAAIKFSIPSQNGANLPVQHFHQVHLNIQIHTLKALIHSTLGLDALPEENCLELAAHFYKGLKKYCYLFEMEEDWTVLKAAWAL
jgi:hypothetical protein